MKTPNKLKISEELFKATFEQAAVGIAHVSPNGDFLRINKKFCDIVGYSHNEMLTLKFQDITHPDDLNADLDNVRQVLNGEIDTYSMNKRYYHKNGSIIWINLTVSLMQDEKGKPDCFVSVIQDITEQKKTEERLRQNRDFLEHLTSAVPDAILSIKIPERTIIWGNDSFNVMGYDPEEYIGKSTKHYYANPEDYETVGKLQQEAIRKGKDMLRTEVMAIRKDGSIFPVELTATYFTEEGKLSRITAMIRDISERRRAEEKLAKSEAKYRSLVDNSIVGVFSSTTDGRLTFVNNAMARMFDFNSPEQMMAEGSLERWRDLMDRERMLAELQKHDKVSNFEAEAITHENRNIHVLLSAKQIGDNILGMVTDVTDSQHAKEQILNYQQRLKNLASELTITEEKIRKQIADDLHDNVGQILFSARMQLEGMSSQEKNQDRKTRMKDLSIELLKAIQATRSAIFDLSPPQLNEIGLFAAIHDWLKEHIEPKYKINTTVKGEEDGYNLAENTRYLLFRSIRELVMNSIKHAEADHLVVEFEAKGKSIHINVKDDGIGFVYDPEQIKRKSDSYGLFSIQERMSDLGGSMTIDSKVGIGTIIKLTVPII
jgi:PAS domain S-box-containing protein